MTSSGGFPLPVCVACGVGRPLPARTGGAATAAELELSGSVSLDETGPVNSMGAIVNACVGAGGAALAFVLVRAAWGGGVLWSARKTKNAMTHKAVAAPIPSKKRVTELRSFGGSFKSVRAEITAGGAGGGGAAETAGSEGGSGGGPLLTRTGSGSSAAASFGSGGSGRFEQINLPHVELHRSVLFPWLRHSQALDWNQCTACEP